MGTQKPGETGGKGQRQPDPHTAMRHHHLLGEGNQRVVDFLAKRVNEGAWTNWKAGIREAAHPAGRRQKYNR